MGGMSAQIPIKNDPKANEIAMAKVRADKLREVTNGHDGTWIAHPLINQIASEIFNEHMLGPNQYHVRREDVKVTAADLLNTNVPGKITAEGGARCATFTSTTTRTRGSARGWSTTSRLERGHWA